jgi:MFS family permease
MTRTLLVAFQQAVRSTTLILLPLAFISLITWATAGSSTGNTADPIRAAVWIYLVAHHIPLDLSLSGAALSGDLTFFPIGSLLIPYLAVRSGYRRVLENLESSTRQEKRVNVLILAFMYAVVGSAVSLFALGSTVSTPIFILFIYFFAVSAISGFIASDLLPDHLLQFPWQRGFRAAWISLVALVGFGGLVFTLSLTWHFATVLDLTQVIQPGFFGGLSFLAIQILYLPNFAIAALSYIAGSGVVIGTGSWLSPFVHRIDEIPALPLLGGLPVNAYPFLSILSIAIISLGYFVAQYGMKSYSDVAEQKRFWFASIGFLFLLTLIAARAASGQLLSETLASVGPQWWLMPIVVSTQFALGILVAFLIPRIRLKIRDARDAAKTSI